SPDGAWLTSVAEDGVVRAWHLLDGRRESFTLLFRAQSRLMDVAFRPKHRLPSAVFRETPGDAELVLTSVELAPGSQAEVEVEAQTRIVSAKLVLVGESGAGKSGLALRMV